MNPLTSYTCRIDPPQAEALRRLLEEQNYRFSEVPHARYAAEKPKVKVVCYKSGKLVVQGKETADFVQFVLEPHILKEAKLGYETVLNPELLLPRIGVDESGKGDFFGPLCVAGVYLNAEVIKAWENAGVRDSKTVGSDGRIHKLAELIRKTPGSVTTVVAIGNEAYNRLHKKLRSVNDLLAWGHARVIENLMLQRHRMKPPPVRAISDQFARQKSVIARALMSLGREIELIQRHKGEEDLAVAAASILARDEFVRRLRLLGEKYGIGLPKGAAAQVEEVGRIFVERHGPDELAKISKMHFRTAARITGAPLAKPEE